MLVARSLGFWCLDGLPSTAVQIDSNEREGSRAQRQRLAMKTIRHPKRLLARKRRKSRTGPRGHSYCGNDSQAVANTLGDVNSDHSLLPTFSPMALSSPWLPFPYPPSFSWSFATVSSFTLRLYITIKCTTYKTWLYIYTQLISWWLFLSFLPQVIILILHLALCLPFLESLYQWYETVPLLSSFVAGVYQSYVCEVPLADSYGAGHFLLIFSSLHTTVFGSLAGRHSACLGSGHSGRCLSGHSCACVR